MGDSDCVIAGLDTVRLHTHLGDASLKREYWHSPKCKFRCPDGSTLFVNRVGYPGLSIEASLPRLLAGQNLTPVSDLEALQATAMLMDKSARFCQVPPDPRNWSLSRADVAFDFHLTCEKGDIDELGKFAIPRPRSRIRQIESTLYLRDTSGKATRGPLISAYRKTAEQLRFEVRLTSKVLSTVLEDKSALRVADHWPLMVDEAWKRLRSAFVLLTPPRDLQLEKLRVSEPILARLAEHSAALDEMSVSDLLEWSPYPDPRADLLNLVKRGYRPTAVVRPSVQRFASVLAVKFPPISRPY